MQNTANFKKSELLKREMYRKSQDEIKIYNPTSKDFVIQYDMRYWVVPNNNKDVGYGKGMLVVPRYLANHYFKHMIDALINRDDANSRRRGKKQYTGNNWKDQEEIKWSIKTSDENLRKKYLKILWKGVHRRFGLNEVPDEVAKQPARTDTRSLDEQLLEEMGLDDNEIEEQVVSDKNDFVEAISE